ncbi:MAG TPA: peptide deformylase [Candidatus Acidoferrales bacterium]|jgi:peptide deformylase|nr:peptide deformylase [Candidatus Acidoferrales bacterium]
MILEVVKYGRPVLRQKGARIEKLTPEIKQLIDDMFETMHERHGVGLAAQQIGKALQLTVIDVRDVKDRPSTLELDGKPAEVDAIMPLVLINPVIKPVGDTVKASEGCLSFPEIFGEIPRPEFVDVEDALDRNFKPIKKFRAGGLLARAIQHEVDHLNGILFIDRMDKETKDKLRDELDTLQATTKAEMTKK